MKSSNNWQLIITLISGAVVAHCSGAQTAPPVAGAQTSSSVAVERPANTARFLYVADGNGIERFALSNGIPKPPADLTIAGVGAPIATGPPHGSVFATSGTTIYEYARGSNKVGTTLKVTAGYYYCHYSWSCPSLGVGALLVDSLGYLYVAYGYDYKTYHKYGNITIFEWDAQIYAPGASGNAMPVSDFEIGNCLSRFDEYCAGSAFSGLALDANGDLRSSYWNDMKCHSCSPVRAIEDEKDPTSSPQYLGGLKGSGIAFPNGLAVDTNDELYVDNPSNTDLNSGKPFIAAYPAAATGYRSPDRVLKVKGAQSFGAGIAVSSTGLLYIPDTTANAVYVVRSSGNGLHRPLATLSAPKPTDAKLGP